MQRNSLRSNVHNVGSRKFLVLALGTVFTVGPVTCPSAALDALGTVVGFDLCATLGLCFPSNQLLPGDDPSCHDGIDNDRDGLTDTDDPDCFIRL